MKRCPYRADVVLALSVFVFAALACGSGDSGVRVTSAEYGDKWPFTVPEGRVLCYADPPRKHVVLDTGNGIQYGLNGSARGVGGFPDSKDITKPGMVGVHLQPFIDIGLKLCGP